MTTRLVKYSKIHSVCVSKQRGVYAIPTWVVSKNNGTIENISDLPQISAILFHVFNKEFLLRGICVGMGGGGSFLVASPPQQHLALRTLSLLSSTPSQTLYKVTDQKKNAQKGPEGVGEDG